jgi:hypothetical protein
MLICDAVALYKDCWRPRECGRARIRAQIPPSFAVAERSDIWPSCEDSSDRDVMKKLAQLDAAWLVRHG